MPRSHRVYPYGIVIGLIIAGWGCGDRTTSPPSEPSPLAHVDPTMRQAVDAELSVVINEASEMYAPPGYFFNEGFLEVIDQFEAYLSGDQQGEPPRYLLNLDPEEELDHYRETIRRWEAQTGKNLRELIDPLKAEVAARDPEGPKFHPEFQQRFENEFREFTRIEVETMRERRNRAIHEKAKPSLDPYRDEHPELVQYYEDMLNRNYPVPEGAVVMYGD